MCTFCGSCSHNPCVTLMSRSRLHCSFTNSAAPNPRRLWHRYCALVFVCHFGVNIVLHFAPGYRVPSRQLDHYPSLMTTNKQHSEVTDEAHVSRKRKLYFPTSVLDLCTTLWRAVPSLHEALRRQCMPLLGLNIWLPLQEIMETCAVWYRTSTAACLHWASTISMRWTVYNVHVHVHCGQCCKWEVRLCLWRYIVRSTGYGLPQYCGTGGEWSQCKYLPSRKSVPDEFVRLGFVAESQFALKSGKQTVFQASFQLRMYKAGVLNWRVDWVPATASCELANLHKSV